jgi:transcriptional regulator with XRE-family HTH domain
VAYRTRDEIATHIRQLREEHGVAQRDLAAVLEIDPSAMNRIEKGERGISTGELLAVADEFGVSVDGILRVEAPAYALRATCGDDEVRDTLEFFRGVIADYFAAAALAK